MSPQAVADEQGNVGYCIEQIFAYAQQVLQADTALEIRDAAVLCAHFSGEIAPAVAARPAEAVMGSLSGILGLVGGEARRLPPFALENSVFRSATTSAAASAAAASAASAASSAASRRAPEAQIVF